MPNPGSDRPLRKVTINLYEEDIAYLQYILQWGYSDHVRDLVHNHVNDMKSRLATTRARRIGDLTDAKPRD
jgi:hypothetical protein